MKKKKKKMIQDIIKKVRYLDSKLEQSKIRSLEAEIERLKAEKEGKLEEHIPSKIPYKDRTWMKGFKSFS